MESIDWEKYNIELDTSSVINCEQNIVDENTTNHSNITNEGNHFIGKINERNESSKGNIFYISHNHYNSNDITSKISLALLCLLMLSFFILFVAINRTRIFNLCQKAFVRKILIIRSVSLNT